MSKLSRIDGVSRYQQVREILRQEIIDLNMKPGERLAAERELADRFGVSRFTVCRALSALVQEGVLVRQQGNGTFVANWRERSVASRTHTVALVLPLLNYMRMSGEIVKGAAQSSRQKDYTMAFVDTQNSAKTEAREVQKVRRDRVDGLIMWPVDEYPNKELFRELLYTGPPFIMVDRCFEDIPSDFVCTDNFWGGYELTRMLIERGHSRIAHFSSLNVNNSAVMNRRRGYEKALTDHGIPADPSLICPPMTYETGISFLHTLAYLLRLPEPITAVVALNDSYAWATYRALQEMGLRVPGDIAIATFFDEANDANGMAIPFIKAVQSKYEIGLRAGEILLDRIEGIGGPDPIQISLKPTIIDYEPD